MIELIKEKQNYINEVLAYMRQNPDNAGKILSDLPFDVAHYVRYILLNEFIQFCESERINCRTLRIAYIPALELATLECWCCNKPLNSCLMLIEEGWTTLKHETDPYIFDRFKAAGMVVQDRSGNERIVTCGYSYS